jgi:hypothetical protein
MSKSDLLLISVKRFYDVPENGQILLDILQHKRGISLRNLEYFVTNYAKQTNLTYVKSGKPFTVHVAYKSSLDGYSKKLFDPFCRTERIKFRVKDQDIVTTVAQLNFIRWCIINDIILQLGSKGKDNPYGINSSGIKTNMNNLIYA